MIRKEGIKGKEKMLKKQNKKEQKKEKEQKSSPNLHAEDAATSTILVTGGAGFIGSHVCEKLLEEGHTVVSIDNYNDYYNPEWKRENITEIQNRIEKNDGKGGSKKFFAYEGDILHEDQLRKIAKTHRIHVIVHLAARAGVRQSIENPLLYTKVNINGTVQILNFARRAGIKNIIMGSSSSVYGVQTKTPYKETDVVEEQISPYAVTKRVGELLASAYHQLHHLNMVCLRFFTVYGPRGRPDMAPYKFTKAVLEEKEIEMYGGGETKRDYTYVGDIAKGVFKAVQFLETQNRKNQEVQNQGIFEIINLGQGRPIGLKSFIQVVETEVGKKARLKQVPPKPGDVPLTFADIRKAKKLLGYEPHVEVQEGMKSFVAWYQNERGERGKEQEE